MAEQGCLLSSCAGNRAEGSNPSLSAARLRTTPGFMASSSSLRSFSLPMLLAFGLAGALALSAPALAQPTGGVGGVVEDATGAVLAGARVTLVETGRGLSRTQAAGANGRFGFAGLRPGRYAVSAAHPGFAEGVSVEGLADEVRS